MSKTKGIDPQELALLNESFPTVEGNDRVRYPRMQMLSKDITEETGTGKNKKIKVIEAAGTFYVDMKDEDTGDFEKKFLEGEEQEFIIVFHRKQCKYFDKSLEKFISTPIFDNDEQVIPLYLDKRVIARGTKAELQAKYPALTQKGKPTTDLKEYKILYVLHDAVMYELHMSVTSGWAFSKYASGFKDGTSPATVVTLIGSIEETNGSNTYRKMTFKMLRDITSEEFNLVKENQQAVKESAASHAEYLLAESTKEVDEDAEMDEIVAAGAKQLDAPKKK